MALLEPATPKKACQIQRSCEATASRMIVRWPLSPRVYWAFHAFGHCLQAQCMQSILLSILGNPWRCSCMSNNRAQSEGVGFLKYWPRNISTILRQKRFSASIAVVSAMRKYLSRWSAEQPCPSWHRAAVHFWMVVKPSFPTTSCRCWK